MYYNKLLSLNVLSDCLAFSSSLFLITDGEQQIKQLVRTFNHVASIEDMEDMQMIEFEVQKAPTDFHLQFSISAEAINLV